MRFKLLSCKVRQHDEHAPEGVCEGQEYPGKRVEDDLENVERSKDVCESFHGLNILPKINQSRPLWKLFFDESPKRRG